MPSRRLALSLLTFPASLVVACADGAASASDAATDPNAPVSLVSATAWKAIGKDTDPFTDRPADDSCDPSAYGIDAGLFGVYTGDCRYLTAEQPMLVDLAAGDTVVIEVGHGQLLSMEPATGHMAIAVPGRILWESSFAIPGPPWFGTMEIAITDPLPAGAPILFHAHNHGPNSYRLIRIERQRPE